MDNKYPIIYKTSLQRGGSLNGIVVENYKLTARNEEEKNLIESWDMFKTGTVWLFVEEEAKFDLNKFFVKEELAAIEENFKAGLITGTEVKESVLALLTEISTGKSNIPPEGPKDEPKEVPVDYSKLTMPELTEMIVTERQLPLPKPARKEDLIKVLTDDDVKKASKQ